MNFNKLYESIFEPASPEEVKERKDIIHTQWLDELCKENNINCKDIQNKPEYDILKNIAIEGFNSYNANKLLPYGSKYINIKDREGWTPLISALLSEDDELTNKILDIPGVELNFYTKNNHTPLKYAIDGNNVAIIRRLLKMGADPNLKVGFERSMSLLSYLKHFLPKYNNDIDDDIYGLLTYYGAKE